MGRRARDSGDRTRARAVVLAHRLPWPPQSGADLRNWQNVKALAGAGGVAVLALSRPTEAPPCAGVLRWQASSESLLEAPLATAAAGTLRWLRDPGGHPSDEWFSEGVAAELGDVVTGVEPELVVVEHLWLHRYIPRLKQLGCRVVLDAHNLEGPFHADLARERGDPLSAAFAKRASAVEAAALEAVDQIWVCSEDDARRVGELYPSAAPAVVVPNTIDVGRYARGARSRPRASVVYPGAFEYLPNGLAASRLVDEIFPALADACPAARLALVGSSPTPAMLEAAARDPRIDVTGTVPDTLPFLHGASAMAIPLHEGGGTRLKALEAFAAEVPVVSTAKGVEGLDVTPGEHYLRAETTSEFVEALLALFDDERLASGLSSRALARARERYSHAVADTCIQAALAQLGAARPGGEEEVVDVARGHRSGLEGVA